MKLALWILSASSLALFLTGCGNSGGSAPDAVTGPFDSRGNYREEWADNPTKWRKSGSTPSPHELRSDELPEIVKNDQPPQNAVPLAAANTARSTPVISSTPVKSGTTATKTSPPKSPTVIAAKPKPKPKPKPVVVKPKTVRYVVKSGDSLSKIASRTGSSISAIQRANGISGTLIRPGQSLVIPRK